MTNKTRSDKSESLNIANILYYILFWFGLGATPGGAQEQVHKMMGDYMV